MARWFFALLLYLALVRACVGSTTSSCDDTPNIPDVPPPEVVNCTLATCGEHLFLTPYLKSNRVAEAKKAAQVPELLPGLVSYAGYFTVDQRYDSNMFFWFFPSQQGDREVPLILWLAGGPGGASVSDAFTENGPILLGDGLNLTTNPRNWAQEMNLLYIDNPVGAGFSFTRSSSGYTNDEEAVGRNLYSAMYQFFQLFPEYLKNDFFISGASAAGKFVPALGYTIHKNNPTASMKINLKGIAIGDGWVDPVNQLGYSEYLYNLGLIDIETKGEFAEEENHIRSLIKSKSYVAAASAWLEYIADTPGGRLTSYWNATGFRSTFNYLDTGMDDMSSQLNPVKYLNSPELRKQIHAGDQPFFWTNLTVMENFNSDMAQSIVPWLEVLMDHYQVLIYNGQLDVICAYPLTVNYIRKLKWGGADEYLRAKRLQWHVDGELAGYAKSARNFTEVLVRNAGHGVTADQPLWARDMMKRFTRSLPFGTST